MAAMLRNTPQTAHAGPCPPLKLLTPGVFVMRVRIRKAIAEWQVESLTKKLTTAEMRALELRVYRAAAEQHPEDEDPATVRERIRTIRSEMKAKGCDPVAYANRLLDECELPYSQSKYIQWAIAMAYSEGFKRGRLALLDEFETIATNERMNHQPHPHDIKMVGEASKAEVEGIIAQIQGGNDSDG